MMPTFASHLDALGQWRADTDARLAALARFARGHDLLGDASAEWFEAMRHRLAGGKGMVAFGVGADQRDLLLGQGPAHDAGLRRPHHHVPGGAGL